MAQKEHRHAGRFCGKRQLPARGQVIGPRLAPEFDENGNEHGATRRIESRLQNIHHPMSAHHRHGRGRDAEFDQAGRIDASHLGPQQIMPCPEDGGLVPGISFLRQQPAHLGQGETGYCRPIGLCRGIYFMQTGTIHSMPERRAVRFHVLAGVAKPADSLPHEVERQRGLCWERRKHARSNVRYLF